MAAAPTLLTEISISVMGVGTWGRSRVSEMGGLGPNLPCTPAFSLLQPLRGSHLSPSLGQRTLWQLRPDNLSQMSGYWKCPLVLAGLQGGGLAKSTKHQCPLPQSCSPAMRQLSHITHSMLGEQQSPGCTQCPAWLCRGPSRTPWGLGVSATPSLWLESGRAPSLDTPPWALQLFSGPHGQIEA